MPSGDYDDGLLVQRLGEIQTSLNRTEDSIDRVDGNVGTVKDQVGALASRVTALEAWKKAQDEAGAAKTESNQWVWSLVVAIAAVVVAGFALVR